MGNIVVMDKYIPDLLAVVSGEKTPIQAIALVETDKS
jgi:hypothetical protein